MQTQIFFKTLNFFGPEFFRTKNFFGPIIFSDQKLFRTPKIFPPCQILGFELKGWFGEFSNQIKILAPPEISIQNNFASKTFESKFF